ncbi:MAG: cytochrome c [bacterium]|nr:cytochrome c [bacterium]
MGLFIVCLVFVSCGDSHNWTKNQKQGKRIYEALCDRCHNLIDPTEHTDAEWAKAVPRYGTKLKLKNNEIAWVVDYLSAANDKTK